jgi:hypothetical protein
MKGDYIKDQLEDKPWSKDINQVQVMEAGEKDKKKGRKSLRKKVASKM